VKKSIARMISQGRLNKQMAFDLEISEKTVQAHRSSMCKKLKVRNAADVTKFLMKINEHES
jgi:DNA-binding NarL/FixJ family response regulator